jgi:hypothetical protein
MKQCGLENIKNYYIDINIDINIDYQYGIKKNIDIWGCAINSITQGGFNMIQPDQEVGI